MTQQLLNNTLQAMFSLSRATLPVDASSIARVVGTSPVRVAEALVVLEQRGLVDASRARLTMLGLAKAVANGVPNARRTRVTAGNGTTQRASTRFGYRRGNSGGVTPSRSPVPTRMPSELPIAASPRVHH